MARAGDAHVDMAYFAAGEYPPADLCQQAVRAANVYVLVAGFRYGSTVRSQPDLSYTELEFQAATDAGLPRLVFILGANAHGPASMFVDVEYGDRQLNFRRRLLEEDLTVATVTTPDGLETALLHALTTVDTPKAKARPRPSSPRTKKQSKGSSPDAGADPRSRPVVDLGSDSSPLEQRLRDYYGVQKCVVDGDSTDESDWVALDADVANLSFVNLVPLSRKHRLRPAGHRSWQWGGELRYRFSIDLTAENLLHQSRKHFHQGSPALAYGCARLGEALSMRSPHDFEAQPDDGWAFLCQCMFYLPYRMETELLEAILQRIHRWLEANVFCPRRRRSNLLLAIANIYQDIGYWSEAGGIYRFVLKDDLLNDDDWCVLQFTSLDLHSQGVR